jgi:hypothetical protein
MNLQEQISRIQSMMGLITEEQSNWNKCNKCIGNYQGSLNKCGFYAIERFEENYGTSSGGSMGDDYFEGEYQKYDGIINDRLSEYIPNAWNSMGMRAKMQLWNFMFNSDSGSTDKFRWLAILYLTANPKLTSFNEPLTMKIIGKKDSKEWKEAIELVNSTTNWNYNKLIKMIEGQYGTYGNKSALQSSWSYRAKALDEMYEDCVNGIDPKSNQTKDITKKIIQGKDLTDLREKLSNETENISIDENSIEFDTDNLTVKFNTGKTKIIKISLLFDNISKENLDDRLKNAKVQNPTYKVIKRGEKQPYWWSLSIIE